MLQQLNLIEAFVNSVILVVPVIQNKKVKDFVPVSNVVVLDSWRMEVQQNATGPRFLPISWSITTQTNDFRAKYLEMQKSDAFYAYE